MGRKNGFLREAVFFVLKLLETSRIKTLLLCLVKKMSYGKKPGYSRIPR